MTDFVRRIDRIEIGEETADFLVAFIDLYERDLARRNGTPLPARLAAIRGGLAQCTGARRNDASTVPAGHDHATGVDASSDAVAALGVSPSEVRRVDTTTAAQLVGISPNGIRDLCRRGKLVAVKDAGRHWISADSLERYQPRKAVR